MWPFLKRRQQEPEVVPGFLRAEQVPTLRCRALSFDELVSDRGDFSDLASETVALKFWLPESMERALGDVAKYYQVSMSMMVRILLVDYVYGRYALVYMQENQLGIYRVHSPTMFSRRGLPSGARNVYKVPELGKNLAPVKVWIAQRLKDDMMILDEHADVLLSRFEREIVVGAVIGRGTLPERPELRAVQASPACDAWEQDREVPMREVAHKEIGELIDYMVETIYDEETTAAPNI